MIRRTALTLALAAAGLTLAACGPGAGQPAKSNPAMPPADPARASRTNGLGPDGKPIDAVAAAEMKESDLPPLKGAGPAPDVPAPPPFEQPAPPAEKK